MSGFVDRRLAKDEMALNEMEQMDRKIAGMAEKYGLKGDNLPKVIGATDERAWVRTQYLVAWGSELRSWKACGPRNNTIHYTSQADPQDLGSLHEFGLLEGRKVSEKDIEQIAITIGRHREIVQTGRNPRENPLWSFAASTFTKAVILDELAKHGRFDLNSPSIQMSGPVARLSFRAPWTEHQDDLESGTISISGTIMLPASAKLGIGRFKGRPLSHLIAGKSYEVVTIKSLHIEPSFLDDDSEEISLTIFIDGQMERLGKAPQGIEQDRPIERWLEMARD